MEKKSLELPEFLTVRELAERMEVSPIDVIKELMNAGVMANINQQIDYDTAAIIAEEMGFEPVPEAPPEGEAQPETRTFMERLLEGEDPSKLRPRPPVVTMLGHVDHGKTSLLDAIRNTNVQAQEAGGITQHIGAYQVEHNGHKITFLDTPGHEAFTAMRARGAQGADIAILVVAADDGVMPQTKEAIAHARAANVPIVVALNKIDKPNANPDRVMQQLADEGLVPDSWGGDTLVVPVSAKKRIGLEDLLESILLVAEEQNFRANPNRPAVGTVIEGRMDRAKGPVGTLLVQNGTLRVGDAIVAGTCYGRVRAMFDANGRPLRKAPPSTPALVMGLNSVPEAGQIFEVVENEKTARRIVEERLAAQQAPTPAESKVFSLEEFYSRFKAGDVQEFNLIVKADVQGSIEPIVSSLEKLSTDEIKVNILHKATGNVSESDVTLAIASRAIIVGFNVDVDPAARRLADAEGVDIRIYKVIYHLTEDMEKALHGMLEPTYEEHVLGHAEVRKVFRVSRVGNVAGCYVTDGVILRNANVRVLRGGEVIHEGKIASLKRFTEDVREVRANFECGIALEGFNDFQEGDVFECYRMEVQQR